MQQTMSASNSTKTVSIVIPVFNEEEALPILFDRLTAVLSTLPYSFELFFIDDGSTDRAYQVIKNLQLRDSRIKAISFSRNFGHQAALTAGLQYATGDAVITMDGDLQHPPALIRILLEKWQEGFQIVYTTRKLTVDEPVFKKLCSRLFYRIINTFSETPIQPFGADFRLLDRSVVQSLNTLKERNRFLRGLIGWMGYSSIGITFTAEARVAGVSQYSTRKMLKLAIDGLMSFTAAPLHFFTCFGLCISSLSFLYVFYCIYAYFFTNLTIHGWTSILVAVLFLGGMQLISIGLIGEYIVYIYNETKGRPIYIIKDSLNIETI